MQKIHVFDVYIEREIKILCIVLLLNDNIP